MVDIELRPEEYELIEKWFGLLYGNEAQRKPSKKDLQLYQKIAFMHIAEMQNNLDEDKDEDTEI
jgi:hypothetical protein